MIKPKVLSVRLRKGSALERLLDRQDGENITDRLHRLAERLEVQQQADDARRGGGA